MLAKNADPRVRGYVVWVPMRRGTADDVPGATAAVPDPRALHFWDAEGFALRAFRPALGLIGPAWDVYLLYGPDARWDGPEPPKPAFWMHQLGGPFVNGPRLDAHVFADQLARVL